MAQKKTITAIATPPGIGALAVIRISGDKAFNVFEKIIEEKQKFQKAIERFAHRYKICEKNGKLIDEVIAIKYKKTKTYTGENLIEIISHGGYFTVKKIYEEIIKNGARVAEKGEFTKRAFINGKIDLMKAEAIDSLIKSKNEIEHNIAINSYNGKNKKSLKTIEEIIKEELSYIEAEIEFEENENEKRTNDKIKKIINEIEEEINRLDKIETNKKGIEITIIGPTNAGKSSLFNFLLGYKRSIVNEQEGTTRDKISEGIEINGKEAVINDTAGMRKTNNEIEKQGQEITEEAIEKAQIIIWVTDISKEINEEEKENFQKTKKYKPIIILNKNDLIKNEEKEKYYYNQKMGIISISIKKKINTKKTIEILESKINTLYKDVKIPFIFLNKRQKETALQININLKYAVKNWEQKEIASYYLNKSLNEIEKIYGNIDKNEIINKIFDNFCIGK
jgi:tRNA modification GTPase